MQTAGSNIVIYLGIFQRYGTLTLVLTRRNEARKLLRYYCCDSNDLHVSRDYAYWSITKHNNNKYTHWIIFHLASRFEIGSIVDHHESAVEYHHIDDRSSRKPNVCSDHHHLYIRRHRNAAVLQRIYAGEIWSRSSTEVMYQLQNLEN